MQGGIKAKIKRSDNVFCRLVVLAYKFSWVLRNALFHPGDFVLLLLSPLYSPIYYFFVLHRLKKIRANDSRKVILFINHEESRTGAPMLLFHIARSLSLNFNVIMISLRKGSMHREFRENFSLIIYPHYMIFCPTITDNARRIVSRIQPDLIYANSLASQRYAKRISIPGVPLIFHVHELKSSLAFCFYREQELRDFPGLADIFIAPSKEVADFLKVDLRCPPSKVQVIPGFVSREEVLSRAEAISEEVVNREIKRKPGETVVIAVGDASHEFSARRKGLDLFIDACGDPVMRGRSDLRFVWMGRYRKKFAKKFIERAGPVKDRIVFIGEKENPFPFLKAADIFVLPSREDPLPLVVFEAMALGKPVIAFRDSGGSAGVIGDLCGIPVNPVDASSLAGAIVNLANSVNLRTECSKNGPVVQINYDRQNVLPLFHKLVRKLLELNAN